MKTENLIDLLAGGDTRLDEPAAERQYTLAIAWGAGAAALLMLVLLGVRDDLLQALTLPAFWIKLGFVASLAAGAFFAALRLSRPGTSLHGVQPAILLPVLGIWAIAACALLSADPPERSKLLFGETWQSCPLLIAMLSAPIFFAVMRAMQEQAPTRPALAGAAAGLLSGAIAAVVYCLHCPEMAAPFVGLWYLLGILIPACVGALLGKVLFHW